MLPSTTRVPVSITDLYGGFARATGLLILESDSLILEFQVKDEILGVVKGKPKSFKIPLVALDSVAYSQNIFSAKVELRVKRLRDLEGIPNAEKGEIKLKIARRDRQRAKEFVSSANYQLSEIRLDEMGNI